VPEGKPFLRYPVTADQAAAIAVGHVLPVDVVEWEVVLQRLHRWMR
jgi:hypothetical protein